MRPLARLLFLPLILPAMLHAASEPEDAALIPRQDPLFSRIDSELHTRFPGATILKVERKERDKLTGNLLEFTMGISRTQTLVLYKLTLTDALNKSFDVIYDASAELVAAEKYKTTFDALPAGVKSAIDIKTPNAGGSTDVVDARLEKGTFKAWGKINGKKFNVEVPAQPSPRTVSDLPAEVISLPSVKKETPVIISEPLLPQGKPEIATAVDGPFRALFKDATILHVDHKETPNVTIHVFSVGGGGSKYELTLSDPLNKKFKVVYTESGRLYSATNFQMSYDRLPDEVQSAIEKVTSVTDRSVVLDVRVDRKPLMPNDHGEYKVSGKINGTKISVDVPIHGNN